MMKKILIGLIFTFFMITNINAEVEVKLKNDEFVPGKTIEVDIDQMKDMDSAIYNAWLENDIEYKWYLENKISPDFINFYKALLLYHEYGFMAS